MSTYTDDDVLKFMKMDLQKLNPSDLELEFMTQLIASAKKSIETEGITLDMTNDTHIRLITMYASYLYRKRAESENAMPRMLRYALNEELFKQKMELI